MIDAPHTAGPWRWEFNHEHKRMKLVGGRPEFDLTIMSFDRWGMSGAVASLRDTAYDGMNIMHRVCDRPDWIAPFDGRKHHADWCADIIHPDMRLMAAAPDLLAAAQAAMEKCCDLIGTPEGDALEAAIEKATGVKP